MPNPAYRRCHTFDRLTLISWHNTNHHTYDLRNHPSDSGYEHPGEVLLAAELWQELLQQAGKGSAAYQLGRNLENKLTRYQAMLVTGESQAKAQA